MGFALCGYRRAASGTRSLKRTVPSARHARSRELWAAIDSRKRRDKCEEWRDFSGDDGLAEVSPTIERAY